MLTLLKTMLVTSFLARAWSLHEADDGKGDPPGDGDKSRSDSESGGDGKSDSSDKPEGSGGDGLGENARKAIDVEKTRADLAEKAAKKAEKALEDARKAAMTEQERATTEAVDKARKEARLEAIRETADELLIARAGAKINLPDALLPGLFKTEDFIDDEGKIDRVKMDAAIDKVLKDAPHLKKTASTDTSGPDNFNDKNGSGGGGGKNDYAIGRAARSVFERSKT